MRALLFFNGCYRIFLISAQLCLKKILTCQVINSKKKYPHKGNKKKFSFVNSSLINDYLQDMQYISKYILHFNQDYIGPACDDDIEVFYRRHRWRDLNEKDLKSILQRIDNLSSVDSPSWDTYSTSERVSNFLLLVNGDLKSFDANSIKKLNKFIDVSEYHIFNTLE